MDVNTILGKFQDGARNIAALSLSAGYPIEATIPIIISNAFKNLAALSLESGYLKSYLVSKLLRLLLLVQLPK